MQTSARVVQRVSGLAVDRRRVLFASVFAACVVSALVLIWSHRFLPLSDYPDWLFEGSVAAELLQGGTPAAYTFKHYPVPNSGAVVLIGLLDFVFPPEVSGKLVLTLCVILLAFSSTYLLTSIRSDFDNPLLWVPLLFLLNTFFFWGELSYLLGLSLLFLYCGYLFRRLHLPQSINWWLVGGASVAIFFCHFIPYATAMLVTLTLFMAESRIRLVRPLAISLAPSIGLTAWYVLERLSQKLGGSLWTFWTPHQFAGRLIAAFSPFPEFLPWLGVSAPGMKAFALLNLLVTISVSLVVPLCIALWAAGRIENHGILASAIVCGLAAIASGYEVAGPICPGERFLYPAVWIGLCWLIGAGLPRKGSFFDRVLAVGMIVLVACQIAFLQVNVARSSDDLTALYSKLLSARSQSEFCDTYETYLRQSWDAPHRTGFDSLLSNHVSVPRLPYYLYLQSKVEAPIFQTSALNYNGRGDNGDVCKPW